MRIFELIYTTILLLAIIVTFFIGEKSQLLIKYRKLLTIIPGSAIIIALICISFEGFRFVMGPLYLLSIILFIIVLIKKRRKTVSRADHYQENQIQNNEKPKKKHRFIYTFGIIVFCIAFLISIILSWFLPVIHLPKPSGPSKVGTIIMDFTNPSRTNILTNKKEAQKIGVQVWYPASDISGKKRAHWMNNHKVASLFSKMIGLPNIFDQFCLVETNSYLGSSVSNESAKYPVVLFSGGAGMFNGQNTIQMEELASHGYIVFAVSHPNDDFATIYSDGTILPYSKQLSDALSDDTSKAIDKVKNQFSEDEATPKMQRAMIKEAELSNADVRVWAEDLIFIANQIEKMNEGSIESIFKGKIDTSQIGVFGHSFGGAAAGQACLIDSRFKAFINIDGSPFGDAVDHLIKQPFMVLGTGSDSSIKFRASDGYNPNQKNYMIVNVEGTEHMNFTDLNTVIPRIGKTLGALGNIDSNKQTKITNTYVLAFFEHYLKGSKEPLLERKDSTYSEVSIKRK
ncbi:alpha/beta hydrolase [Anaeromicropila herbilytica]|uniref:Platelet-activating factor acetylhydrolase n=1 Tax=Anaeromicropila herbilytica TaxID=2785025 RepID=A0A7R7EI77_9FIRM|nr:isoform II [Anaeromicropila herbilytica]BCN29233.1 hypothetical protein bsdtb5_05280 [Anaeromicropila herbilytica]